MRCRRWSTRIANDCMRWQHEPDQLSSGLIHVHCVCTTEGAAERQSGARPVTPVLSKTGTAIEEGISQRGKCLFSLPIYPPAA